MHAHALGRQIAHRVIERGDIGRDDLAIVGERQVEIDHVAQHREIGAVELQDEAGRDDRLVFLPHDIGERENVVLGALVVVVLQVARDLPGRWRGHENVLGLGALGRCFGDIDIRLRGGPILPVHRAIAGRAVLERRGEVLEDFRKFGEFRLAGAHRRRALTFVTGQPLEHMHGIIGAALFAVIDDVDAAFDLLAHHLCHGLAHRGLQFGAPRAGLLLFGEQQFDHLGCARQAAGVRREDAVGHFKSPYPFVPAKAGTQTRFEKPANSAPGFPLSRERTERERHALSKTRASLRSRARHSAGPRNNGRPACATPGNRRIRGSPWCGFRAFPTARTGDSAAAFHASAGAS